MTNTEIKFRGKRIDNGEWVCGFLIAAQYDDINAAGILIAEHNPTTGFRAHAIHNVIPETIGQYTGIRDAEGEKIYKGDIFGNQFDGGTGNRVVEFHEGCFVLVNSKGRKRFITTSKNASFHGWFECGTGSSQYAPFVKLGNIYENPELLP